MSISAFVGYVAIIIALGFAITAALSITAACGTVEEVR